MSTTQPSPGAYGPAAVTAGETAVIRGVGRCILLLIVSFGLWSFAWMYHTTKEVSSRVRQPPPSAGLRTFLYAIPIANLVVWFLAWQDIEEYCKRTGSRDFPMVVFWILTLIFSIVGLYTYPVVQMRMNDAHRAATQGRATTAPMQAADWIAIAVGWGFVLIAVAIIVVAAAAS
ncbi:MAG TPA: DUF4234 domain-containing protein [Solirubrobacter sp.]|nr:DUF4234 domain-containing protein [Solirubrobacter sp.]